MRRGLAEEMQFVETIQEHHDGIARIELEVKDLRVEVAGMRIRPLRALVLATLLVGTPETLEGELVYPLEVPALAVYEVTRDGEMSLDDMFLFMLARALNTVWPGASAVLV